MGKTVGRFDYHIIGGNGAFGTPLAYITLQHWTKLDDGQVCITPQMTELEIDTCVSLLKDDLDAVAKKAKAQIQRAKK